VAAEHIGVAELGAWSPLTVPQVAALFGAAPFRWWIAGGWAIDLAVGHATRPHEDIEIAVLRDDQLALRDWLRGWEIWYVPGPGGGLIRWTGPALPPGAHELWCREHGSDRWQLEVLLEQARDGRWLYRRDPRISLPLSEFGATLDGVPVVRPEVALLYKSKRPRERDEADLRSALALLDARARNWLAAALESTGATASWTDTLRR
jgi:hypothetical protein